MHPDLAPWLTLSGSKYPYLEQISMVLKMFEPLKFHCIKDTSLSKQECLEQYSTYLEPNLTGSINFDTEMNRINMPLGDVHIKAIYKAGGDVDLPFYMSN